MELTLETFNKGIEFLWGCYSYFGVGKNWYQVIKLDITDEEFMPLIIQYCRTEHAPTCPADIINFKRNKK